MGTLEPQQKLAQASSAPAWRSLPFYNCVEACPPSTTFAGRPVSQVHSVLHLGAFPVGVHPASSDDDGQIATSSASKGSLHLNFPHLVTLTKGLLVLVDPTTLQPLTPPFPAIQDGAVTHVEYEATSSHLVVLSEDQGGAGFPLLRIWNLKTNLASLRSRKGERDEDGLWQWRPRLMAEGRVQHGRRPFPIAAVSVTAGLGYLACSLSSGAVLLLRKLSATLEGAPLPTSANPIGPAVTLPKFKVVYQPGADAAASSSSAPAPEQEPVTALAFSSSGDEGHSHSNQRLSLFIATLSRVMKYTVLGKGAGSPPVTLDDIGSPLGCSVLLPPLAGAGGTGAEGTAEEAKLLIARPEAIYTIGSNGREDCYAYEGSKAKVLLLPTSRHLVVLSPPLDSSESGSAGASYGAAANGSQSNGGTYSPSVREAGQEVTRVSIFDLDGKFLSYTGTFTGALRAAFPDSASSPALASHREDVFLLSESGSLLQLSEKPLREKIEILYRKHLFLLASQVAKSHFGRLNAPTSSEADKDDPESVERLNVLLGEIWIKYGDHLYEKGDHEGSMKMGYLKSVGAFAGVAGASTGGKKRGRRKAGVGESYIIRKFLDAQRIPLLTLYLQELHRRGLANSDHTTLLLNCYTKMKDTTSLDRFIRRSHVTTSGDADGDSSDDDSASVTRAEADGKASLPFDLPTAIKVCRAANYFDQAAYLARKFGLGEEYLRIKIEDTNKPFEAIEWLRTRQAAEVIECLKIYAGLLLSGGGGSEKEEAERQTTDLLIELCAGAYRPHVSNSSGAIEQAAKAAKSAGEGGSHGKGFLSYLTGAGGTSTATTELETDGQGRKAAPKAGPYVIGGDVSAATSIQGGEGEALTSASASAPYEIPSARQFFPHFIRFPRSFRRFLETVALARFGQAVEDSVPEPDLLGEETEDVWEVEDELYEDEDRREQRSIWNTLLEMYLKEGRSSSASGGSTKKAIAASATTNSGATLSSDHQQALNLLRQHRHLPYDISHALILCEHEEFTEGIVALYERMGMYEEILTLWMEKAQEELKSVPSDAAVTSSSLKQQNGQAPPAADACPSSTHVLSSLARYHTRSPTLYTQALSFLISHPLLLSKHRVEVEDILVQIEEERLMSTLEIVGLLSKEGGYANVGLIRGFLEGRVREEREEEEADHRLIESYRAETAHKEKEIEELTTGEPRVFQSNRCTACGGQLDLPAVHFMCKHSYHARCLGEAENECPSCARAYGVVRDIRKNNQEMASRHDLFLQEVREADDPFQAVASMFSRGVFSQSALAASAEAASASAEGGVGAEVA